MKRSEIFCKEISNHKKVSKNKKQLSVTISSRKDFLLLLGLLDFTS